MSVGQWNQVETTETNLNTNNNNKITTFDKDATRILQKKYRRFNITMKKLVH